MSEENTLTPDIEARFQELAGCVNAEDWSKLIAFTSERMLKRLAIAGVMAEITPEQFKDAHNALGEMLVEYTNAALTCVAQGERANRS